MTSADLIAAGLQSGWIDLRSATTAEMCGHDIDVPESIAKLTGLLVGDNMEAGGHAAKMFTPGAAISGCRVYP